MWSSEFVTIDLLYQLAIHLDTGKHHPFIVEKTSGFSSQLPTGPLWNSVWKLSSCGVDLVASWGPWPVFRESLDCWANLHEVT